MKKLFCIILCLCMLLSFSSLAAEIYTVNDAMMTLRGIIDGVTESHMDANVDGEINLKDVLYMLKIVVDTSAALTLDTVHSTTVSTSGLNWWDLGVQYPRLLLISNSSNGENGTLLATFEELNSGLVSDKPGYPIYKSTDDGENWARVTVVRDNSTQIQSEWNPHLFELSQPLGDYAAGTILLAGCSVDAAHSSKSAIRLYASTDGGASFGTPITVAEGGGLDNGVWEPYLLQLDDGRLVCYYSDDTDSAHSQKIVYKVSSDGVNFGDAVEVVASDIAAERPGMPVVTRIADGSYFMVYEVVDCNGISGNPVFYRTSTDGLDWGDSSDLGTALVSTGGKALGSAPYCVWTPVGGKLGTIIVSGTFMRKGSSDTGTDYFISRDGGKTFDTFDHIVPYDATVDHCGYSNSMAVSSDGKALYAINNPVDASNSGHAKIVFAKAEWAR